MFRQLVLTHFAFSSTVFSNEICNALGGECTEPYDGFFETLAEQGSLSTSIDKDTFKTWIQTDVWESLSMDSLLAAVPDKYFDVSEVDSRLDEFLEILFDGRMFHKNDLIALQEEFGFEYIARRLTETNDRHLATQECQAILFENVIATLVLLFKAIGFSSEEEFFRRMVDAKRDVLYPAFETQWVRNGGLNKGFLLSVLASFLTNLEWIEIELILEQLMKLFITRSWSAVSNIDMAFSSIFDLYDTDLDKLVECFGD